MKKIAIVAHEFSPLRGSECSVGWNFVNSLLKNDVELTVYYATTNQFKSISYYCDILNYYKNNNFPNNLKLVNVDQPSLTIFLSRLNRMLIKNSSTGIPLIYWLGYRIWQNKVYKNIKLNENNFSCIHLLTSISMREPGNFYKLNIPFIWGPTSGVVNTKWIFIDSRFSLFQKFSEVLRTILNKFYFNFSFKYITAAKKAKKIFVVSEDDLNQLKSKGICADKILLMSDVGCYDLSIPKKSSCNLNKNNNKKIKILIVSRLVVNKGIFLFLDAIKDKKNIFSNLDITIVGDGPLYEKIINFHKENVNLNLNIIKFLEREELFNLMKNSDLLVNLSLREAGSSVVMEAISCSLPVLCHNSFGMKNVLNSSSSFLIDLVSPAYTKLKVLEIIESIISDPSILNSFESELIKISKANSWTSLGKNIVNYY